MRNFRLFSFTVFFAAASVVMAASALATSQPRWTRNDDFIQRQQLFQKVQHLEILNGIKMFAKMKNWPLPIPMPLSEATDGALTDGMVLGHADLLGVWTPDCLVLPVDATASNFSADAILEFVNSNAFKTLVESYQNGNVTLEELCAALLVR